MLIDIMSLVKGPRNRVISYFYSRRGQEPKDQQSSLLEVLVVLGVTKDYIEKSIQVHLQRLKTFGLFGTQI